MPARIIIPKIPNWMLRRIGFLIVVLFAAIIINFIIPRLMPGDFTTLYVSADMPPEVVAAIRKRLGLDQPLWSQFIIYIKNTLTLNFGNSYFYSTTSVSSMIATRLPRTLAILIPSEIICVAIGYYFGVISGWRAGSKRDSLITGISIVIWAMPIFWAAMLILYIGGFTLGWFPLGGYRTVFEEFGFWGTIFDRLRYLVLPILALITKFGATQLVMRNTMTITLKQNYITTAKAKGLSENRVKHRHAARNAMLPMITASAMRFAMGIAGLIFIEKIFSYPGMGRMIFDAVYHQDFPVLQASFLVLTIVVIVTIVLLDLIYARLDPRVRYE